MILMKKSEKQVRRNNDAAFQRIFLFNTFCLFYGCYLCPFDCPIDWQLLSHDSAIDFAIFTMWLQTCGWTDGQTDRQNNGQTDRMMGGQTNK